MTQLISDTALRGLKGISEDNLPHLCEVYRAVQTREPGGLVTEVFGLERTVPCRVSPWTKGVTEGPGEGAGAITEQWAVTVPASVVLRYDHKLIVRGSMFGVSFEKKLDVVGLKTPRTYGTMTKAITQVTEFEAAAVGATTPEPGDISSEDIMGSEFSPNVLYDWRPEIDNALLRDAGPNAKHGTFFEGAGIVEPVQNLANKTYEFRGASGIAIPNVIVPSDVAFLIAVKIVDSVSSGHAFTASGPGFGLGVPEFVHAGGKRLGYNFGAPNTDLTHPNTADIPWDLVVGDWHMLILSRWARAYRAFLNGRLVADLRPPVLPPGDSVKDYYMGMRNMAPSANLFYSYDMGRFMITDPVTEQEARRITSRFRVLYPLIPQ